MIGRTPEDIAQLREILTRLDQLETASTSTETSESQSIVPSLDNFLDNSDFIYSDEAYNSSSYTDDDKVLAEWYARTQASTGAWTENTTSTESSDSIRGDDHSSPRTTVWDKDSGTVLYTGGQVLAGALPAIYANGGNYLVAQVQLLGVSGNTISDDLKLKASIFESTNNRIVRGEKPTLTLTKVGSHTGGTTTREYILEVQLPNGSKFYSDTVTPASVASTVNTDTVDSTDYLDISWDFVAGASRYTIYRRTPSESDTAWKQVDTITNGSTSTNDFGNNDLPEWTVPTFDDVVYMEYQKAIAYYDIPNGSLDVDQGVNIVSLGIRVPSTFVASSGEVQFLQLEIVQDDYTDTSSSEVSTEGVKMDRVGLSYTNGRWTPSARDKTILPTPIVPIDPPVGGSGGGGDNPPTGGGQDTCVSTSSMVLMWNPTGDHYEVPAGHVVLGDQVVSVCPVTGKLQPSIVREVIRGYSTLNHRFQVKGYRPLMASFNHRMIADMDDFEKGTLIPDLPSVLVRNGKMVVTEDGFTVTSVTSRLAVVTYRLQKNRRNYIANNYVCHNFKRDPEEGGGVV